MGASIRRRASRKQKFGKLRVEGVLQKEEHEQYMRTSPSQDVEETQAPDHPKTLHTLDKAETDGELLGKATTPKTDGEAPRKHRFICFIGNLPFTATTQSIAEHFTAVKPSYIRHSTEKTTGQSRGFAFLEFDAYHRMQSCIRQYHHSSFPNADGTSRKINVELTVGGGANSNRRKAKIYEKNEKLSSERKEKRRKRAQTNSHQKESSRARKIPLAPEEADIHPSRRNKFTR